MSSRGGNEQSIQGRAKAARKRALHQAFVQPGENVGCIGASLVNAAQGSHDERTVHRCGQAFAHDVAEIDADQIVGQAEEIGKVAANFGEGHGTEGDLDGFMGKTFGGHQRGLNEFRIHGVVVANASAGAILLRCYRQGR